MNALDDATTWSSSCERSVLAYVLAGVDGYAVGLFRGVISSPEAFYDDSNQRIALGILSSIDGRFDAKDAIESLGQVDHEEMAATMDSILDGESSPRQPMSRKPSGVLHWTLIRAARDYASSALCDIGGPEWVFNLVSEAGGMSKYDYMCELRSLVAIYNARRGRWAGRWETAMKEGRDK